MTLKNEAKAKRWFGLHMVDGTAEYREQGRDPYKIFVNETTLRQMDASFEGRPVFVQHVDGVSHNIEELKKDADGWVIRSFFNQADGKHWCEFMTTSDDADRKIAAGWKLSNCYVPTSFGQGSMWNGMEYEKEIKAGVYEHLAIVANPRYEESMILSPDQFKKYNEDKQIELTRLANAKNEGEQSMKFTFFKRAKVENSADLEGMCVELPKSKQEVTIADLITQADEAITSPKVTNTLAVIEVAGEKMTVGELVEKYLNAKKNAEKDMDCDDKKENDDEDMDEDDPSMMNDEDEDKEMKLKEEKEKEVEAEKKKNEADVAAKKAVAKVKADRLRNANSPRPEESKFIVMATQVAKGKARYGS